MGLSVLAGFRACRRWCTVRWIRLSKAIRESDIFVRPATKMHRKLVVIGDGFAEGLGDWVILGGPAGVCRFLSMRIHAEPKVRMQWSVINRGRCGTTSADWAPDAPTKRGKNRFTRVVESSACADADIFVIVLGTEDIVNDLAGMPLVAMKRDPQGDFPEAEMCATARNVRKISDALRARGKRVLVCGAMASGEGLKAGGGASVARRLNRQLQQQAKEAPHDPRGGDAAAYVRLDDGRTSRPENRAFDGLHLNSRGYRFFAAAVMEEGLRNMLVASEFQVFRGLLGMAAGGNDSATPTASPAPEPGEPIDAKDPGVAGSDRAKPPAAKPARTKKND